MLVIDFSSILNPAISALEKVACPSAVISANLVPDDGSDKEFAAKLPDTVTHSVIVPPTNLTFDAVICPLDFNNKPELDMCASVTSNPPIDAEVNLAAPADVILANALVVVEPSGTNIESAVRPPLISAPAPIIKLPSPFKWKLEELISILSS